MVFGLSSLNRVYNFKRVCPGSVLDRVWLQDCRLVFGNPKSVFVLMNNDSRLLSFHLGSPLLMRNFGIFRLHF